ncbi:hypothetical protein CLOM_g3566 [Closterium sp. NIES-68]|nr:hypothetical protein CLOM_g3566 [Closterium sp. NIES-68]GJP69846.1 hypothetical protein CLOP_g855 [Closterium sp. NIES-67]
MAAWRELAARRAVFTANGALASGPHQWPRRQAVAAQFCRTPSPGSSLRRQPHCSNPSELAKSSFISPRLGSLFLKELVSGLPRRFRRETAGIGGENDGKQTPSRRQRGLAGVAQASFDYVEFTASLDTNIPLRERPEAPFHAYLENPNRVFNAFFPDKQRAEKLSEDEWRIHMLPITFFLVTARPIVDMRIFLDRPSLSADKVRDASLVKHVMRLQATNWELKGVDYDPSKFSLDVRGSLFAQSARASQPSVVTSYTSSSRQAQGNGSRFSYSSSSSSVGGGATITSYSSSSGSGISSSSSSSISSVSSSSVSYGGRQGVNRSMLRGQMAVTVGMQVPPNLFLVPRQSIEAVGSAVLQQLLASMKDRVNNRVLEDYAKFAAEHSRSAASSRRLPKP